MAVNNNIVDWDTIFNFMTDVFKTVGGTGWGCTDMCRYINGIR